MKQNSIDWLVQNLKAAIPQVEDYKLLIGLAKDMHKAEIMQTYSDGLGNGMHFERGDGSGKDLDEEQYYKETYGGDK